MPTIPNEVTLRDRLRTLALVLYGLSVPVLMWCYFVIPAPGRWPFVLRALASWKVLWRGH
jgi:hypothetical protein